MPLQTDKPTPLEAAQSGASTFAINLLLSAALSETMNVIETIRLEGQQLLVDYKKSEGTAKDELKTAISMNIQDRKFLLQTIFVHPLEKNV
jgi:hypothetical protein